MGKKERAEKEGARTHRELEESSILRPPQPKWPIGNDVHLPFTYRQQQKAHRSQTAKESTQITYSSRKHTDHKQQQKAHRSHTAADSTQITYSSRKHTDHIQQQKAHRPHTATDSVQITGKKKEKELLWMLESNPACSLPPTPRWTRQLQLQHFLTALRVSRQPPGKPYAFALPPFRLSGPALVWCGFLSSL